MKLTNSKARYEHCLIFDVCLGLARNGNTILYLLHRLLVQCTRHGQGNRLFKEGRYELARAKYEKVRYDEHYLDR